MPRACRILLRTAAAGANASCSPMPPITAYILGTINHRHLLPLPCFMDRHKAFPGCARLCSHLLTASHWQPGRTYPTPIISLGRRRRSEMYATCHCLSQSLTHLSMGWQHHHTPFTHSFFFPYMPPRCTQLWEPHPACPACRLRPTPSPPPLLNTPCLVVYQFAFWLPHSHPSHIWDQSEQGRRRKRATGGRTNGL